MTLVMTYGDSNTHGTPPIVDLAKYSRFGPDTRWPTRMARDLGVDLVEEGLPGRTTRYDDPIMGAHMNGQMGLKLALECHGPIDVLVIMLVTYVGQSSLAGSPAEVQRCVLSRFDHVPSSRRHVTTVWLQKLGGS